MRKISLDWLTVYDVQQPELVEIASELGYQAFSAILSGFSLLEIPAITPGTSLAADMAVEIERTGMALHNIEFFPITPDINMTEYQPFFELGETFGAGNLVSVVMDDHPTRSLDNFCKLCESAASFGMSVVLEPMSMPTSMLKSVDDAVAFIGNASQPNAGLQIDLLHLMKSGGKPADIRRIDPALILSAQLCDGPASPTDEQYFHNAVYERQIPGEGELPVEEFLRELPETVMVGIEVPLTSQAKQGIGPRERARNCLEATHCLIDS